VDVSAKIIRLKTGSRQKVRDWARELNRRRNEALETLRDEGVEIESWFTFSDKGEDYLIGYMRCESQSKAATAAVSSEHSIDEYHQRFKKETWDRNRIVSAELLVDLCDEQDE